MTIDLNEDHPRAIHHGAIDAWVSSEMAGLRLKRRHVSIVLKAESPLKRPYGPFERS